MSNSILAIAMIGALLSSCSLSRNSQQTEAYTKVEDPKQLGLALTITVYGDVSNSEILNVKNKIEDLSVNGKKLELLNTDVVNDDRGSWILTKGYGRLKVTCTRNGGGCALWLTPSQRANLTALYQSEKGLK